ncbi:MAG TPA: type II toxin-antitoxin system HigB family toxin [Tangfeifania sp.]|nr:type II toxin-antitoxin system HigB family toxin [Tangfeifania sp.]
MKVHLIKRSTIEQFVKDYTPAKRYFQFWLLIIKSADWDIPQDIVTTFNSADILGRGSERVVFNIGRNKYRMICSYYFGVTRVHLFVKWIGTHAAYDKLCKDGRQYEIDVYN